ncbi:MAG: MFS transporter [Firmicutes bacterium]|nr:MFS transporter [Alicyclobacillaceae bacterium]MCL6497166.1 MFS transporter [Bacillota bacterium]
MQKTAPSRAGWAELSPTARQLLLARFLRAVAQGAMAVDFTLYLKARGWSAADAGLLLMAGGFAGAGFGLLVGLVSDRVGRRIFLLIYEAGLTLSTAAIVIHPAAWLLVVAATLFGFGRGANGASGPFAPAEQAWLAQAVPAPRRGAVFSLNAGMQFWGMGAGSLLAAVLPHLLPGARGASAYLPLFLLNLVVAGINFGQIWVLEEGPREEPAASRTPERERAEAAVTARENRALTLLVVVNLINSVGVGLVSPLLPYWFNVRFGVGPSAVGPVYALTFVLTGLSSLAVGRLSEQVGLVRAIVLPRILGVAFLALIPFMPSFGLAASLFVARSIVNRSSAGARQAFSVSLVRDRRRGFASSLNAISWSLAQAAGPAVGGWLIDMGSLVWPFLIAAAFQLAYVILFPTVMGRYAHPGRTQGLVAGSEPGRQREAD